ncbi:MAG: VOC family protein [Acidimicrobiia bacterium]
MAHPFEQVVTFLYVDDLERSREFYEGVLRLALTLDQGQCRIYRVTDTSFVGVCHGPDKAGRSDGVMLAFVTDEVEETFAKAVASGADVVQPPGYNRRFNIFHAIVCDPDGHRIELQQFRDPRWPRPDDAG